MKKYLHNFRHLHIALFVCGLLIGIVFRHRGWPEFWGFLAFVTYCCWNVFAFTHGHTMLVAPRMTSNVKSHGDKGARQFLFAVSIFFSFC